MKKGIIFIFGTLILLIVLAIVLYILHHEGVFTVEGISSQLDSFIEQTKTVWNNLTKIEGAQ